MKPREKLISMGVSSLSDIELLAIILRTGSKNISVFKLVIDLLESVGGFNNLSKTSYNELIKIKGIKSSKACIIIALFEIALRVKREDVANIKVDNPKVVYDYFKDILINKTQEHFYVLYLNNKNICIKESLIYIGTKNSSLIDPKDIFKEAYLNDASGIILVHNHPSGDNTPSNDDILTTNRIIKIGLLFGIKVIDHIIIGSNYLSFKEENLL